MGNVAIITDSNSGITQKEARDLGINVVPMPFFVDGELHYEDIDFSQEDFYRMLTTDHDISTSQPSAGDLADLWTKVLKDYEEIVYIPMSSGLSGSCSAAMALAEDFDGRVVVVNNQRISVTQKISVLDAMKMAGEGKSAREIKDTLEEMKFLSSIYITLSTLKYLKKGGRLTPAAAALGTLLRIKPVLQIKGEKLDSFAKARTIKHASEVMIGAVRKDMDTHGWGIDDVSIAIAFSGTNRTEIEKFREEVISSLGVKEEILTDPLSLSVSCHIGDGAIALTVTEKLK